MMQQQKKPTCQDGEKAVGSGVEGGKESGSVLQNTVVTSAKPRGKSGAGSVKAVVLGAKAVNPSGPTFKKQAAPPAVASDEQKKVKKIRLGVPTGKYYKKKSKRIGSPRKRA